MVQFYPRIKFCFSLFCGMVMLIMSLKQRKIKFKPRIKLNHNIYIHRHPDEESWGSIHQLTLNPAWTGQPGDLHSWSWLNERMNGNFGYNIMDHKLLLNFGAKFLASIYNFICEIYKIAMATCRMFQCQRWRQSFKMLWMKMSWH